MPATTYIRQPPCHEPQKIELQVYAVVPKSPEAVRSRRTLIRNSHDDQVADHRRAPPSVHRRHQGVDPRSPIAVPFREQSDQMFANAARLLEPFQTKFTEVCGLGAI
jgi:hypothetical protein